MESLLDRFLERLFDIMLVIVGGLISGLIGLYLDNRRRKAEARAKHFEEIKKKVLEPIRENHRWDTLHFDLREGFHLQASELRETLQGDIHWWENYSLRTGVDELLYDDLANHFKHLPKMLLEVEEIMKTRYPRYLWLLLDLYDLVKETTKEYGIQLPGDLYNLWCEAILFIALRYNKGEWPNLYRKIRESSKFELISELGAKMGETKEAKEILHIRNEAKEKIETCMREIGDILHQTKLKGNCKYTKI